MMLFKIKPAAEPQCAEGTKRLSTLLDRCRAEQSGYRNFDESLRGERATVPFCKNPSHLGRGSHG